MQPQPGEVIILAEGQSTPAGTTTPLRKAKWYDTFIYIANPEKFCQQNLAKYGAVFNTGVFGDRTIFVGSSRAIQKELKITIKLSCKSVKGIIARLNLSSGKE